MDTLDFLVIYYCIFYTRGNEMREVEMAMFLYKDFK
jgi:hypothetical protein